jgi:hypothetical protein
MQVLRLSRGSHPLSLARCEEGVMPAKSPLSGTPPAAADDQAVGIQDPSAPRPGAGR